MIVISDTTPLISLLKIDKLELLQKLFGEIFIPKAVFDELTMNPIFLEEANKIKSSLFIKVCDVTDKNSVDIIMKVSGLDIGESEAIVLANELKSDLIIIDEARGRFVATQMNLKLTGTLGILFNAYKRNLIDKLDIEKCIEIIRSTNIRISEKLLKDFLDNL